MASYGIDLGSSYSRIAKADATGQAVVLLNATGEQATPSVVFFESAQSVVVGRHAKDMAVLAPDLVVEHIKRQMGSDVHYTFHGQDHTPESISGLILRDLVAAQDETGDVVRDVVITVPAFFGLTEREATRKAGQIAGLNVLSILPEPIAAALSYQVLEASTQPRHIFVYDLGGATFNTAVIRLENNDAQIVCTDGDHHLGGADWDACIINFLLRSFADQYPQLDPSEDQRFLQELATAAERLKRALSATRSSTEDIGFGGSVAQLELTREHFEELTSELLERTMEITHRTIITAQERGTERFDDVLLVGGMARMPVISATLRERFGMEPKAHEPDLAVAKGAALYAPTEKIGVAEQAGLSVAQIVATAAASTALVPFIQALAAKAAGDVYSTLRSLRFHIRPRNISSSTRAEPVVHVADGLARVVLELPPALNDSDQETLHRLLEGLVYCSPDPGTGWLRISRSSTGGGWSVELIDRIPPGCTILEHPQAEMPSTPEDMRPFIAKEGHTHEQDRIMELERERKFLREMIRYLAAEIDP